jgi:hypothetical protein
MADVQAELVRRYILLILDAARTRDRERSEDPSTYTAEELVQLQLKKMGVPMLLAQVRAELYYLHDKGLVKFHKTRVGREDYFTWRIAADGVDVLEGARTVAGVARE